MTNNADPDQFRSQLIWIYTVCKGRAYPGSAGLGLTFTTFWTDSTDDNLDLFFFSDFSENRLIFMQSVSLV